MMPDYLKVIINHLVLTVMLNPNLRPIYIVQPQLRMLFKHGFYIYYANSTKVLFLKLKIVL